MGIENLWKFTVFFRDDPITGRFKYKYGISSKGHDYKVPIFGRIGMFSKDPSHCEERGERSVKSEIQFDVFHYPDSRKYQYETVPRSVIFYLQWLFPSVFPSTISEFLTQIEKLNFNSLTAKYVDSIVDWIVKQASAISVTDFQCVYLFIVLGHVESNCLYPNVSFPSGHQTAKACDRLLQCLSALVNSNLLSTSNLKILKKVATLLVKNSSSPGWLTLAAYFYPYLGIKFLLSKEYATGLNYRYSVEEYQKWLKVLFLNVKEMKNRDDQVAHQRLLFLVLKSAPILDAASGLFERADVRGFFLNEDEMVDFFLKFYQDKHGNTGTHKETGAKLAEFFQIPKIFRSKMNKFLYPILLEYAKSNDELKDEHEKIFLNSIISIDVLTMEQVLCLLTELSKSKSVHRQNLLLKILSNQLFERDWQETQLARKVGICKSWVMTRVNYNMRAASINLDKTKVVFEAIDAIIRCSLNITNVTLAKDVSTHVVEKVLGNEDALSILQAFASIEKCVPVVQDCYKSHVRKILEQTPKVVKKSSKFLKECSTSRYAFSFL
jgi:hypothetical protein